MFEFFLKKRERLPLPYKRELHCHIIPGVDDGVQKMETSIRCLTALQELGVEEIIFTPHCIEERFENTVETIHPIFKSLQTTANEAGLTLKMTYSFEYRLDEGFLKLRSHGKFGDSECKLRPLYGRYLLIENSFIQPLQGLEQLIYQLQADGYYLILAHPERYEYYAGHNGKFYHSLQDQQVEFQCNILSFAGYYGRVAQKMAYWMLDNGYVNFLGSDVHGMKHIELISDFLRSKEYERIHYLLGNSINNDRMER